VPLRQYHRTPAGTNIITMDPITRISNFPIRLHRFFIDFHRFSKMARQQLENHEKMEGRRKSATGCLGHATRSPGTQRSGILKNGTVLDDPGLFFHKFSRKSIFSKIDENRRKSMKIDENR